jgi:hypothetical protein
MATDEAGGASLRMFVVRLEHAWLKKNSEQENWQHEYTHHAVLTLEPARVACNMRVLARKAEIANYTKCRTSAYRPTV